MADLDAGQQRAGVRAGHGEQGVDCGGREVARTDTMGRLVEEDAALLRR
jgi:hypothetical protein